MNYTIYSTFYSCWRILLLIEITSFIFLPVLWLHMIVDVYVSLSEISHPYYCWNRTWIFQIEIAYLFFYIYIYLRWWSCTGESESRISRKCIGTYIHATDDGIIFICLPDLSSGRRERRSTRGSIDWLCTRVWRVNASISPLTMRGLVDLVEEDIGGWTDEQRYIGAYGVYRKSNGINFRSIYILNKSLFGTLFAVRETTPIRLNNTRSSDRALLAGLQCSRSLSWRYIQRRSSLCVSEVRLRWAAQLTNSVGSSFAAPSRRLAMRSHSITTLTLADTLRARDRTRYLLLSVAILYVRIFFFFRGKIRDKNLYPNRRNVYTCICNFSFLFRVIQLPQSYRRTLWSNVKRSYSR